MKKKLPRRGKYWQETPQGVAIPIPKRGDVLRDLAKAGRPQPAQDDEPPEAKPTA